MKKDQSEIKNAISEINNTLEEINSRLDEAEDRISDLADKVEKTPRQKNKKKKECLKKDEEGLRNILVNKKHNNICIMGIPEGEESKQGIEKLFEEIMMENIPIWWRKKLGKSKKLRQSQTGCT